MKNRGKDILVAAIVGIFILATLSIDIVPSSEAMAKKIVKREAVKNNVFSNNTYFTMGQSTDTKIDLADLPQAVKSAVLEKYVAYSIDEVFCDVDGFYRLVLKNGDTRLMTFYAENGEYLRHEVLKSVKMVALN